MLRPVSLSFYCLLSELPPAFSATHGETKKMNIECGKKIALLLIIVAVLFAGTGVAMCADSGAPLEYAQYLRIEEWSGCKLATILSPRDREKVAYRFLLVPRGTPVPKNYPKARVFRVPVERVVSFSTTHLAYIDTAGKTGDLVGLSGFNYVNTPSVRRLIESGKLEEVGQMNSLKLETVLDLSPDLILTPDMDSAHTVHSRLLAAGLPAVPIMDHVEEHPLGRCEWIKLLALFLGTESHADTLFNEIAGRYHALVLKAASVRNRPRVIAGAPFQGQWYVARGNSFVAQFIRDAGGDYIWSHIPGTDSVLMDAEAAYEAVLEADIWLNPGEWKRLEDGLSADPRFAVIPAMKPGKVFNYNKRLNRWGGNDYWESGMLRPDEVLADLIAILHPEILPDRELMYYRKLE